MNVSTLKSLAQPSIVLGTVAALAVASVVGMYVYTTPHTEASYVHPTRGLIIEEVDTTGTVKAAESVDLSFEIGGRIAYVGIAVGSQVAAGQTLAGLSAADLSAAVKQAKATLAVQQAKLDALKSGARPEDIAVSQTAVTAAQTSLVQAKQAISAVAQDAYVKSDDAIRNKVDQFFSNPRTSTPTLVFGLSDSQLQSSIIAGRLSMEAMLTDWQTYLASLPPDPNIMSTADIVSKTRQYLSQVGLYLDQVAAGLTKAIPVTSYPTATIQGYETNVATARTNISADVITLNAAETTERGAESALAEAQSQLTLKQAGASAQDIEAQTAQAEAAQANVDAAQAQLGKTVIVSPIAGTITKNDAHLGATASPGAPLISINSDARFQIESYVSEADVAKIKVGNGAAVALDAYQSGVLLSAHVTAIDPAATIQNGIASYKVTLQFDTNDPRPEAGMTGNIKVTTQAKEDALQVPTSAIITRGNGKYVLRAGVAADELTAVTIGILSTSSTEITSGLSADDRIRSFGSQ